MGNYLTSFLPHGTTHGTPIEQSKSVNQTESSKYILYLNQPPNQQPLNQQLINQQLINQQPNPQLLNQQNALAYNASQPSANQNTSSITLFNNPNNLYVLIDTTNLQNCIKSNNFNLTQALNCVSTYIKGVTFNSTGSNYVITNLLPTQQNGTGYISPTLSAQQIQQLQSSIFTAYGISNNITSQLSINLNSLWSIVNTSNDITSAIASSIQGFNNSTNSYVNLSQLGAGITCDSNGNMVIPQNLTSEQNFETIEKFNTFENDTKTIIFIVVIILYLVILAKY